MEKIQEMEELKILLEAGEPLSKEQSTQLLEYIRFYERTLCFYHQRVVEDEKIQNDLSGHIVRMNAKIEGKPFDESKYPYFK